MSAVSGGRAIQIDPTLKLWSGDAGAAISRQRGGRTPASARGAQCSHRVVIERTRAYDPSGYCSVVWCNYLQALSLWKRRPRTFREGTTYRGQVAELACIIFSRP
jgi:hypothetical protein